MSQTCPYCGGPALEADELESFPEEDAERPVGGFVYCVNRCRESRRRGWTGSS